MNSDSRPENEMNPYAAPQVPNPLVDFAHLGIGAWRDGNLMVMHKDAVLPPFCVKTGEPAHRSVYIDAVWLCQTFKIYVDSPKLAVPLTQPWRILAAWYRQFLGLLTFAIFFVCFALAVWLSAFLGWRLEVPAALFAGALCLGLVVWAFVVGDPLSFVRSEGHYHWLKGASKQFLDRLPQWRPYD